MTSTRLSRRRLLRAAALSSVALPLLTAVAACDTETPRGEDSGGRPHDADGEPRATPEPDPDLPLLVALIAAERDLVRVYEQTLDRYPRLGKEPAAIADRHRAHLAALEKLATAAARKPGGPGTVPTPSTAASEAAATVPATPAAARKALLAAEKEAAKARLEDLRRAHGGDLARLLASLHARETLNAESLAEADA
ncbi:MAG TPA: hypothetical protein VI076_10285 [Actinopolymorphaceae bacterium]